MFTIQKHLFYLLIVRQTPSVVLKCFGVYFTDKRELILSQNKFVLFIAVVVHNKKLLELSLVVLR